MKWKCLAAITGLTWLCSPIGQAADIGGWFEQQSRQQQQAQSDDCAALIARTTEAPPRGGDAPSAQTYYAMGLCYLHSSAVTRDPVAAQAWLEKAAELHHPLARQALLSMRERGSTHPPGYHCHDLGLGRRLCHGQQPSM
jgi:TPR repeat protein